MSENFEILRDQLLLGGRSLVLKKLALIFGVVVIAAMVAFVPTRNIKIVLAVVGVAAAIVGGVVLYRTGRFEYGILALIPVATLTNFITLPTGTASRLVISLLLGLGMLGLWVVQVIFGGKRYALKASPATKAVLWFVAVSIFAYIWSNTLRDPTLIDWAHYVPVRLGALAVNIGLPLLSLLVFNKFTEERWLRWMTWITIGIGGFVVFAIGAHLHLDALFSNGYRGLFSTWVVSMALAMALFNETLSRQIRIGLFLVVVAWTIYAFLLHTTWFSGWVPFAVSSAIIILSRSRKLFFSLALVVVILAAVNFSWLQKRMYQDKVAQGDTNRPQLWAMNLALVLEHPLFGVGPAGYAPYYMTYHPEFALSTHNNYFDVLAQTGAVGFVVFAWMMITFIVMGNRARRVLVRKRNFEEAFANGVLGGIFGALTAMMLGDWVLPFAYNQTITGFDNALFTWIFIGGLLSLYAIMQSRGDFSKEA